MSVGFLTRVATATTFALVTYNVFLSTTHFHNNRAYLIIVLGLLAVAPCGRELSLDAWIRRRRGQAGARHVRARLAVVAAAIRVRRDLRGLRSVEAGRPRLVRRHRDLAAGSAGPRRPRGDAAAGLGDLGPDRPGLPRRRGQVHRPDRAVHRARALVARTRYAAVWVAVVFHLSIETSASVQVFSLLGDRVLVVWAVRRPGTGYFASTRARATGGWARRWARSTGWRGSGSSPLPGSAAGGHRPRRHRAPRGAGGRVHAQPPATDRLVRPARPAAPRGAPRAPRGSRDDARSRGRERTMTRVSGRLASRSRSRCPRVRGGGAARGLPVGVRPPAPRLGSGRGRLVRPQPGRRTAPGSTSTTPMRT